ncbi:MAG: hybrid sensor histidine kinase/response regulator, partial [Anaerolineae bacterium]|nr:hybrid sensor histidine kinase/response regulator [Anaerolineae bacterium]
ALTWVWDAYQRALKNEMLARERQGRLSQTLKALDEAQYRLERNNYLLALARDEAEEARQAKQQFIQTISHELRTPLNLIIGFSEIMANDPETYGDMAWPANLRSDVEQIYRSSRHLASLIDDVLDLSAVEARRMRLSVQQADIRQVIEEAVSVVHGLFERKGLYLKIDIAHDVPELVLDPLRIRQVLLNLLSNASRHTDAGGVSITVRRASGYVEVSVADTGSGIAPEDRHKVFEEFGRLDGPGKRGEGTGLGLALSKRFVELHGGTMDFESTPGKGTRFYFSLPVPSRDALVPQPQLLRTPGRAAPPGTRNLPLLLVTGVDSLQMAALRRLEGFAVMEVSRPEDLARLVEQYGPAGLVINSGDDNSSALIQTWSSHAPSDLPIITLALQDSFSRPQPLHVHEFLLKPVTRERLLEAIGRLRATVETVLIVDDDLQVAELLSRMLESAGRGWRTVKCFCGQEALNRMFREPPDLVLLDLALPDLDGQTVLQTMRNSRLLASTPVIVVTGRDHLDMIEGGRTLTLCRGKGYTSGELLAYLRLLLSTHSPGHAALTRAPAWPKAPAAGQAS